MVCLCAYPLLYLGKTQIGHLVKEKADNFHTLDYIFSASLD